jgi:hypothetical protein
MANVVYSGFAFESEAFPGAFLRMDANGVVGFSGPGAGTVNCQGYAGAWERFQFLQQPDGTTAINSIAFPKAFLRMDGGQVTKFMGPGGGVVNCQGSIGPWEKFKIHMDQSTFHFSVESVAFPNRFLRMDGTGVVPSGPGSGIVNCQFGAFAWERFVLRVP